MSYKRIASSGIAIALVWCAIYLSPLWIFAIVCTLFIGLGTHEFFSMLERKGVFIHRYFGLSFAAAIPLFIFATKARAPFIEFGLLWAILLVLFCLQFTHKENTLAVRNISVTFFGIIYISWIFSYILKIRFITDGANLVAYLLLVCKSGDIGAYAVGTFIGHHPLIPRISPHKSVEGLAGGLAFSIVISILSASFIQYIPLSHLAVLGLILGGFAQFGDLTESLIKRDCQVKDSGVLAPGLGGALDLMDSLLFAAPTFYLYLKVFL